MKRSCSLWLPVIGIGVAIAIAIGFFILARPMTTATAIATAIPILTPTFLAFCFYFLSSDWNLARTC
jgi:hypothetical protein